MKGGIFPLGAIRLGTLNWTGNLWRENSFALHLLRQSVNPSLNVQVCLQHWQGISRILAEPPRERHSQLAKSLLS